MSHDYKKPHIWSQLKGKTSKDLKKALDKDENWSLVRNDGNKFFYQNLKKPSDRQEISIHLHETHKAGYGEDLLRGLLGAIGWTEDEMRKLKLIK